MKPSIEWCQQSLAGWEEHKFTMNEIIQCEIAALKVMNYRERNNPLTSPCWMDEWTYGYFCALRDIGAMGPHQWRLLVEAFTTEGP